MSEITEDKVYWLYVLDNVKVKLKFQVRGSELKSALLKVIEARYLGETS